MTGNGNKVTLLKLALDKIRDWLEIFLAGLSKAIWNHCARPCYRCHTPPSSCRWGYWRWGCCGGSAQPRPGGPHFLNTSIYTLNEVVNAIAWHHQSENLLAMLHGKRLPCPFCTKFSCTYSSPGLHGAQDKHTQSSKKNRIDWSKVDMQNI